MSRQAPPPSHLSSGVLPQGESRTEVPHPQGEALLTGPGDCTLDLALKVSAPGLTLWFKIL